MALLRPFVPCSRVVLAVVVVWLSNRELIDNGVKLKERRSLLNVQVSNGVLFRGSIKVEEEYHTDSVTL